jgi:hypothetical protein
MSLVLIHLLLNHIPVVGILFAVVALVVSTLLGWTANIGGQIRHTEIRTGSFQEGRGLHED